MAKMTGPRIERWQKDLEKMLALGQRLQADLGDAKLNTDGGNHCDVVELGGLLAPIVGNLEGAVDKDALRSPVARIRERVGEAAAARKAAKLRRESGA